MYTDIYYVHVHAVRVVGYIFTVEHMSIKDRRKIDKMCKLVCLHFARMNTRQSRRRRSCYFTFHFRRWPIHTSKWLVLFLNHFFVRRRFRPNQHFCNANREKNRRFFVVGWTCVFIRENPDIHSMQDATYYCWRSQTFGSLRKFATDRAIRIVKFPFLICPTGSIQTPQTGESGLLKRVKILFVSYVVRGMYRKHNRTYRMGNSKENKHKNSIDNHILLKETNTGSITRFICFVGWLNEWNAQSSIVAGVCANLN